MTTRIGLRNGRVAVRHGRVLGGCCCLCQCDNTDILLLVDTTGSMGAVIDQLEAALSQLAGRLGGSTCRFAVMATRDAFDFPPFQVVQRFTGDMTAVRSAVASLFASGGFDEPEGHLDSLIWAAENWTEPPTGTGDHLGGDPDLSRPRIILLFSDAPPHESETISGHLYPSRADALAALLAECIFLFAFDTPTPLRTLNLGSGGAIPYLAVETGGRMHRRTEEWAGSDFADSICDLLRGLVACANDPDPGPCCENYGMAPTHCVAVRYNDPPSPVTEYFVAGKGAGEVDYFGSISTPNWPGTLTMGYTCVDGVWTAYAGGGSANPQELEFVSLSYQCFPFQLVATFTVPATSTERPGETVVFTATDDMTPCAGGPGNDTVTVGVGADIIFGSDLLPRTAPAGAGEMKDGEYRLRVKRCSNGRWCWAVTEAGRTVARGDENTAAEAWAEAAEHVPGDHS